MAVRMDVEETALSHSNGSVKNVEDRCGRPVSHMTGVKGRVAVTSMRRMKFFRVQVGRHFAKGAQKRQCLYIDDFKTMLMIANWQNFV